MNLEKLIKVVTKGFRRIPTNKDWLDTFKTTGRAAFIITALASSLSVHPYEETEIEVEQHQLEALLTAEVEEEDEFELLLPMTTEEEDDKLFQFYRNPKAIQDWREKNVTFTYDEDQFGKDFLASAVNFLRSKKGDCDDILALAHYSMDYSGVGLFLNGRGDNNNHIVYLFKGDNNKYGIISLHKGENQPAKYESIGEAARSFSSLRYNFYKIVKLPNDEITILYNLNGIKDESTYGEEVYFPNKKELKNEK